MLKPQGLGLGCLLATAFFLLEWLHQFPVLSGRAFASDHLDAETGDWKAEFDVGRRLRSGSFEVNGLVTDAEVHSRGLRIPRILHQVCCSTVSCDAPRQPAVQ